MSRKLALLVGSGRYEAHLPPLAKPDADIAALARVLADPAIGGFDEVTPFLDAPSAQVRLEIARFFAARGPDDLLLLYFSGHGLRSDRGTGGLYLAARDTDPGFLSATAIPADYVTGEMDYCRSRRQILILDCCYSGAFERGAKGPAASPGAAFEGNGLGRVVLTASDAQQLAWEESLAGGATETSVFTRHLIQGLESGEADQDGDGLIGVDELFKYVYRKVVEENPRQTPGRWTYREQGDIVLARSPGGPRRLAELPADLRQALESHLAAVREGAVRELARFLRGSDAGLAAAARRAVEQALEDDSRRVVAAATEVLAAGTTAVLATSVTTKPAERAGRSAGDQATARSVRSIWLWCGLALVVVLVASLLLNRLKKTPETPPSTALLPPQENRAASPPVLTEEPQEVQHSASKAPPAETKPEQRQSLGQPEKGSKEVQQFVTGKSPLTGTTTLMKKCVLGEEQTFDGFTYVHLCAGTFTMGSTVIEGEEPVHRVTLSEFWLGKTEITNEQYRRFRPDHKGEDNLPATNVSWDEAKAACERFGARLPTEAEWEYAARAGSQTAWSIGDNEKLFGEHAWYSGNSGNKPHPVGTKKPNHWHLLDMYGNAWEWVSDWHAPYSSAPQTDPTGPATGNARVLRGGSFVNDWPFRYWSEPTYRARGIGFRCGRGSRRQP